MARNIIDEQLKAYLMSDLKLIGMPLDFKLTFRKYSSTMYGCYYSERKEIIMYLDRDKEGNRFSYSTLLQTLVHEVVHHYQYHYQKGYKRLRGVMHDLEFFEYYNEKLDKLIKLGVVCEDEFE